MYIYIQNFGNKTKKWATTITQHIMQFGPDTNSHKREQ